MLERFLEVLDRIHLSGSAGGAAVMTAASLTPSPEMTTADVTNATLAIRSSSRSSSGRPRVSLQPRRQRLIDVVPVAHGGKLGAGHDLRLEAVRQDVRDVVLDDILSDRLDAALSLQDVAEGAVLALDRG